MKKKLIGIDLGGTTVKLAILDWEGEILHKWEIPTRIENAGENILPDIAQSINEKLAEFGYEKDEFQGVGVGVPGPVQLQVGYLPIAVNLGGFGDRNINKELGALLELPVITDNDANVAALGEMWKGSGDGADNVVFYTLGTGVGGGIVVNGQIISGFAGAGGEIGHMAIVPETSEFCYHCNCGAQGCVETVCSATGIVRVAKHLLGKSEAPSTLRDIDNFSAKDVFDEARNGDSLALEVVDIFGKTLAKSLELLSVTVNPSIFVLGGGVSRAGEILLEAVKKHYGTNVFVSAHRGVEIRLAVLGNDAGVIGAARHARGLVRYDN